MPLIESELKKMPAKKKLTLVNKLLKSIDKNLAENHRKTEEDIILEERLKKFDSEEMKFDSWKNAKKRLLDKAAIRNKKKPVSVSH